MKSIVALDFAMFQGPAEPRKARNKNGKMFFNEYFVQQKKAAPKKEKENYYLLVQTLNLVQGTSLEGAHCGQYLLQFFQRASVFQRNAVSRGNGICLEPATGNFEGIADGPCA